MVVLWGSVFFCLKPSVASHTLERLFTGLLGLHSAPCPPHSHHLPLLLVTFGYEAEASAPLSLLGLLCRLKLPPLAFPALLPSLQALRFFFPWTFSLRAPGPPGYPLHLGYHGSFCTRCFSSASLAATSCPCALLQAWAVAGEGHYWV